MAGDILSAHFGHCQAFAFVDVENNAITNITMMDPPEHQPGTFPKWVAANGATDVIAGGMGPMAVNLFNEAGINVFVGAPKIRQRTWSMTSLPESCRSTPTIATTIHMTITTDTTTATIITAITIKQI